MPADTTVLTSSPAGSLRPGLKTRKKIASFAFFIRSNTTARSGGTVRVFGVPVFGVFGEYHRSTWVAFPSSDATVEWASAARSAGPWSLARGALSGLGVGSLSAWRRFPEPFLGFVL